MKRPVQRRCLAIEGYSVEKIGTARLLRWSFRVKIPMLRRLGDKTSAFLLLLGLQVELPLKGYFFFLGRVQITTWEARA